MKKIALITGITGQDGAYLSEFLIKKGYIVHGIKRKASLFNTERIDHLYKDPHEENLNFILHYGDLTDSTNLIRIIQEILPDEIYNLAAQSHVKVSFETPEYTANVDALGTLRILEAIRILNLEKKVRFYQASTSELFGKAREIPQKETTPFYPRSPYGVAKLYAYWITVNYREAYNIFACNGILFNHESPVRGETFVTRKITRGLTRIIYGLDSCIYIGNLDAKRDWGHAKDFVEGMWLMLQQKQPDDYVLSTGKTTSIRDFIIASANDLGLGIEFKGKNIEEKGFVTKINLEKLSLKLKPIVGEFINEIITYIKTLENKAIINIDPKYFRPTEVDILIGDSTKAREKLNWQPKHTLEDLIKDMIYSDLENFFREYLLKKRGFNIPCQNFE